MEESQFVAAVISQPPFPPTSKHLDVFQRPILTFIQVPNPNLYVDIPLYSTTKFYIHFVTTSFLHERENIDQRFPNFQVQSFLYNCNPTEPSKQLSLALEPPRHNSRKSWILNV
jgi:hypothetical protein